ncbi:MAG TPA: hypothetical protein PKD85_20625, partial [Saprospiraceae bacterium]|nr:hypothetical protein [Saprospiraceae bacterium]
KDAKPIIMAAILSLVIAIPLIIFFKIFEINEAMSQYNGYNSQMYWNNLKTALNYFTKFEYLWLAIIVKVPTLLFSKKTYTNNKAIFQTSLSLTLLFIIYILAISRMHGVLYTRYIIYLQPIMSISILFDMILLTNLIQSSQLKFKKVINIFVIFAAILLTVNKIYENKEHIAGHIYEMTHKYEGPLDMMIPYIKENFTKPQNLIIATNYEETSFMYYLKAKVIIGYVQNNLTEDLKFKPDIISYRPSWGDRNGIFIDYIKGNDYFVKRFSINNTPTNMISEFNYLPNFTHKFKIEKSYDYQQSVQLWIHNKYDKDRQ